jgi:hypothetical protein
MAFAYEAGIAAYYGIPLMLIRISMVNILAFFLPYLYIATQILLTMSDIPALIPASADSQKNIINRYLRFAAICCCLMLPFFLRWQGWLALLGLLAAIAYAEFVQPLLLQRHRKTFTDKLIGHHEEEYKYQSKTILGLLRNRYGNYAVNSAFLALAAIGYCFLLGMNKADYQNVYLVIPEKPPKIVLRAYESYLVTSTYHPDRQAREDDLVIVNLAQSPQVTLVNTPVHDLKIIRKKG